MLYCDKINLIKGTEPTKGSGNKECMVCHYWFLVMGLDIKILFLMVVIIC